MTGSSSALQSGLLAVVSQPDEEELGTKTFLLVDIRPNGPLPFLPLPFLPLPFLPLPFLTVTGACPSSALRRDVDNIRKRFGPGIGPAAKSTARNRSKGQ